jgi:hypothetical protein
VEVSTGTGKVLATVTVYRYLKVEPSEGEQNFKGKAKHQTQPNQRQVHLKLGIN